MELLMVMSVHKSSIWSLDCRKKQYQSPPGLPNPYTDCLSSVFAGSWLVHFLQDKGSQGSWPVRTPSDWGRRCLPGILVWCLFWPAHMGENWEQWMGEKNVINIPVPKEGVVAGDGLEPPSPTQSQGVFWRSWMVDKQAVMMWWNVFFSSRNTPS